jgi:hypothetical protein
VAGGGRLGRGWRAGVRRGGRACSGWRRCAPRQHGCAARQHSSASRQQQLVQQAAGKLRRQPNSAARPPVFFSSRTSGDEEGLGGVEVDAAHGAVVLIKAVDQCAHAVVPQLDDAAVQGGQDPWALGVEGQALHPAGGAAVAARQQWSAGLAGWCSGAAAGTTTLEWRPSET